ncbi:oligosaccharide flippase family protein [Vibrio fluvialis]|nr:oligosaccharide flippase family protein [Vibrio fluvialis]
MAIVKDSMIYMGGEVFKKSIPFLMLPYLSRTLGPEGFGELAYYQIYISLFIVIIGLSQASSVARYFYRYGSRGVEKLILSNFLFSMLYSFLIAVPLLVAKQYLIVVALLIALMQELFSNYLSLAQCRKKPIEYVTLNLTVALLSVIFTVCFFEFSEISVENRLAAILLSYFIIWFFCLFRLKNNVSYLRWKNIKLYIKYTTIFGVPLLGHQFSILIKGQLDRVIINDSFGLVDLGIYSAGFQISLVIAIVIMALNRAVTPYLYENFKNGSISPKKLIKIACVSFLIVPIPALVAWSIDEHWYLYFVGSDYVGIKWFVVVFIFGQMLLLPYVIMISYFFYKGMTKEISFITIFTSIVYIMFLMLFGKYSLKILPLGFAICNFVPTLILMGKALYIERIKI